MITVIPRLIRLRCPLRGIDLLRLRLFDRSICAVIDVITVGPIRWNADVYPRCRFPYTDALRFPLQLHVYTHLPVNPAPVGCVAIYRCGRYGRCRFPFPHLLPLPIYTRGCGPFTTGAVTLRCDRDHTALPHCTHDWLPTPRCCTLQTLQTFPGYYPVVVELITDPPRTFVVTI